MTNEAPLSRDSNADFAAPGIAARVLLLFAVIALTVVAYYSGLFGDYIFDDFPNLLNNRQIYIDALNIGSLKAAAFSSGAGLLKRPVSMASFALNYYFFGIKPFSFKLVNLVIHLLCGLALFFLTSQLLRAYRQIHRPTLPEGMIYWIALATTAMWLLHPLNLTGVLFIVQRMTTLATLFTIAGLSCYVWGRSRQWEGKAGLPLIVTGVMVFGLLALLSKESGALLPLYMLTIEVTLFRFRNQDGKLCRKTVGLFLTILVLPAVGAAIWLLIDPNRFLGGYALRAFTLPERLLTETRVVLFYIKLILAPSIGELGIYHDGFTISSGLLNPISTIFAIAGILALLVSGILSAKKAPLIGLGILWFFAGQTMESTFLPLEIAFEHRNYLADFGLIFVLAYLLLDPTRSPRTLLVRRVGLIAYISFLFLVTYMRSGQWSNNVDQAITEAQHHPNSPRAAYSAGRIYVNLVLAHQLSDSQPAFLYLEKARTLDREGIAPEVGLIIFSAKIGHAIDPSWIAGIRSKLRNYPVSPSQVESLKQLIQCQENQCKIADQEILSILNVAFENPRLPLVPSIYADMLTLRGSFLIDKMNNLEAGKTYFEQAVRVRENEPQYRINLINLLLAMQLYPEARHQLDLLKDGNSWDQDSEQIRAFEEELSLRPRQNTTAGHN